MYHGLNPTVAQIPQAQERSRSILIKQYFYELTSRVDSLKVTVVIGTIVPPVSSKFRSAVVKEKEKVYVRITSIVIKKGRWLVYAP